MSGVPPKSLRLSIRLGDLLLLGWFFLYVLFSLQPQVLYQARAPIFSLAPGFINPFLSVSGGLVDYASRFLAQLDAWGWPGAVVRTVEALLILCLAGVYLSTVAGRDQRTSVSAAARSVRLVPVVLYMLFCGRYDQSPAIGPMLIVLLLAVLAPGACRRAAMRLVAYAVSAAAFYYAAAGAAGKTDLVVTLAAFAILSAVAEVRRGHGLAWLWGAACLALPAAAAVVGEKTLLAKDAAAWVTWFSVPQTPTSVLSLAILLCLPLAALAWGPGERLAGWRRARRAAPGLAPGDEEPLPQPAAPSTGKAGLLRSLLAAGALVWAVSLVAMNITADPGGRSRALMDYLVANGRWEEALAEARSVPAEARTMLTDHDMDTALFHTGRLSDDLFTVPQRLDSLLLPMADLPVLAYRWRVVDQWLELGRADEAEMALYEALPKGGDHPQLLRRLAMVYLVKGQLAPARLYLNLLQYDLVYRGWARRTLRLMEKDPQLVGDREVQRLRANLLTRDDLLQVSNAARGPDATRYYPERMLANLLRRNPRNRMAFEYLMAVYLLLGQPEKVAQEVHRLDDFGQKRIPRAWEEGIVLTMGAPGRKPDLGGRRISPETLQRYARFQQIFARCGGDARQAYPEVARECPGSYFAYLLRMKARQ